MSFSESLLNHDNKNAKAKCFTKKRLFVIMTLFLSIIITSLFFFGNSNKSNPASQTNATKNNMATIPKNTIWPIPKKMTFGNESICLDSSNFQFKFAGSSNIKSDIETIISRYYDLIFGEHQITSKSSCLGTIIVDVKSEVKKLDMNTDETYELKVGKDYASITANTMYGALYGLESFSQLVRFNFFKKEYQIDNAPWSIQDAPRFKHREVLIDSARHFLPVRTIKELISSLPSAKINVIHWHLEDSQSFPYCSETFPEFCQKAGFSDQEHYIREDLEEIIEYARLHGVRIMVELDVPGHTESLCAAFPEICTTNKGIISPVNKTVYTVIEGLTKELSDIFPEKFFHFGGDEVNTGLWDQDKATANFMKQNNISDSKDIYLNFVSFAQSIALNLNLRPVVWNEVWDNFKTKLNKKAIIHYWTKRVLDPTSIKAATGAGYNVLYSLNENWYLDNLNNALDKIYKAEPCTNLTETECALVLGGGGEMWGETVDTSDQLSTIWPRLGLVGEVLWSPRKRDYENFKPRLIQFRCFLNRRGIQAAPVNVNGRGNPPNPGSCYNQ